MDFTSEIFGNRQTLLWFLDFRIEQRLRPYAEALEWFLSELFQGVLPCDWRQGWHAFVADQAIQGRITEPQSVREMEVWIEAWAGFCGLLPDSPPRSHDAPELQRDEPSNQRRRHPRNPNAFYKLPDGSEVTEEDAVLAWELAQASERLRAVIEASQAAYDSPGFLTSIKDALSSPVDSYKRQMDLLLQISELRSLLRKLEDKFRELGYDQIEWLQFEFRIGTGIESAERALHAGPAHGIRGVTVETLFTAASIAGLTAFAGRVLARASARLAVRLVKPIRSRRGLQTNRAPSGLDAKPEIDDIVIDTYRNLSRRTDPRGQAHHLNQTAAYGEIIPRAKGLSIKLEGNIFTEAGSSHALAHRSIETFWRGYRGTDIVPTNLKFTRALLDSLRAAGLPEVHVQQAVRAAIRERVRYGLLGGRHVPVVPRPIQNLPK